MSYKKLLSFFQNIFISFCRFTKDEPLLNKDFWETVNKEQLVKILKNKKVMKIRDHLNRNPLHYASLYGRDHSFIPLLLQAGASYSLREKIYGGTPVHFSVVRNSGEYEFIEEFLNYGVPVDIKSKTKSRRFPLFSKTPLMFASYMRISSDVIKFLINKNAKVNIQSALGNTPLIFAVMPNEITNINFIDEKTILLLINAKSDPLIQNRDGKTALDYMKKNETFKKTELFKTLSIKYNLKNCN